MIGSPEQRFYPPRKGASAHRAEAPDPDDGDVVALGGAHFLAGG